MGLGLRASKTDLVPNIFATHCRYMKLLLTFLGLHSASGDCSAPPVLVFQRQGHFLTLFHEILGYLTLQQVISFRENEVTRRFPCSATCRSFSSYKTRSKCVSSAIQAKNKKAAGSRASTSERYFRIVFFLLPSSFVFFVLQYGSQPQQMKPHES